MAEKKFVPYVPVETTMPELTVKALFLGVVMAIVLGAANAYLGMKVGMTVAATFPAAVVSMAVLRVFRGSILEENLARTTASVGEALVAGAVFTIPAFIISGAWSEFNLRDAMLIMGVGGVLGVLFVILLRRPLVVEAELPFPESVAAAEIVKAGQKGQTGAGLVFGSMGIAALWELFKNNAGVQLIQDQAQHFIHFGRSTIEILGRRIDYSGGMLVSTPEASPMVMGVGFIVGLRISSIVFCGAVAGWLVLVPLAIFLNPALAAIGAETGYADLAWDVWFKQIRPLAVGTMIVSAFYTLYTLRLSLMNGIQKIVAMFGVSNASADIERTEQDLNLKWVLVAIGIMAIPMFLLYRYFSASTGGALVLTVVMLVLGVLFAAVAGYLVGLVGASNNPISGLTLSALVIAAVLMVLMGITGVAGVAAVLGVAGVVCCAAGVAGDMMQDFKVGHILGGTPWIMAQGIVGGDMAWPLVIVGMLLGVALILIKAPAPMLIAVGMYLPFSTTAAVFVGGVMRAILDWILKKKEATDDQKQQAENSGILVSSGLIAGQSLMAVVLAFIVLYEQAKLGMADTEHLLPHFANSFWGGLLVYPLLLGLLVWLPLSRIRSTNG
ncbi:MAG: oligopeptide transporter, OPT family [Acidobacteria bacterium]|nr:oligopeptide transporter, OPT family [Candidatus Sulfomarinibacter kjeldsenii]